MSARHLQRLALTSLAAILLCLPAGADDKPKDKDADDAAVPGGPYRPPAQLKGKLRIVGSTTLGHVACLWSESFRRFHPQVAIEIDCEGSETAFPEMAAAAPTLGALSRPVTAEERKRFEDKTKRKLVAVAACEDAVAVVVHKDNPVVSLTLAQLRDLFGQKANGEEKPTWGRVGLTGAWADRPAVLQGHDPSSGTRAFFCTRVLGEGNRERPTAEWPSYAGILKAVAADPAAVGYCRASGVSDKVKVVPLSESAEEAPAAPSRDPQAAARYPLRRQLTLMAAADGKLPELEREFLLFVLSREGQQDVVKDHFTALDRSALLEGLDRLGVSLVR